MIRARRDTGDLHGGDEDSGILRFLVTLIALSLSVAPAIALVPVYPFLAPVLLPIQWLAGALNGWILRSLFGLLNAFVAFQVLWMSLWGFTRCAAHTAVWTVAVPGGLVIGSAMALSSAQGPSWRAFKRYALFFVPTLIVLAASMLAYSPGSNEFLSPGCPR